MMECNCYGGTVKIEEHNVTVTIPPGAIEKGITVKIEVAASLFGSHKVKEAHFSRISPFVWIGASYIFQKPLKVEVEHHAVVSNKQHISDLCVMEAYIGKSQMYDDVMCEASNNCHRHCEIGSSFYTYLTNSGCTCVAKKSDAIPDEVAVYQFLPKQYSNLKSFTLEIGFCCNLKQLRKVKYEYLALFNCSITWYIIF